MSYASCLNNYFSKQTIEDLHVTGSFTNSSSGVVTNTPITDNNNIQSDQLTLFYSEVLAKGNYIIRGSCGVIPLDEENLMQSFSIYESSSSTKYPLVEMTFSEGLYGTQFLPFTTVFQSDGVKPLEFSIRVIGGTYKFVDSNSTDKAIQIIKVS